MNDPIYTSLTAVLTSRCGVSAADVEPAATFEQLGMDSMDYVTLAMALQKELGVDVDDEELAPHDTLAVAVGKLRAKVALADA